MLNNNKIVNLKIKTNSNRIVKINLMIPLLKELLKNKIYNKTN